MSEQFKVQSYNEVIQAVRDLITKDPVSKDQKKAVVLDIDETLLTSKNLQDRIKSKNDIFKLQHYPIFAGITDMIQLHNWIVSQGVETILITGRKESTRRATEQNLEKVGIKGYSRIYFKPSSPRMSSEEYKTGLRKSIIGEGFRILANVGDQIGDLEGGYAEHVFLLPSIY